MKSKDLLQRFIFDKVPVRGEIIHLEHSFKDIIQQHAYPAVINHILGEALCVAGLLAALIKFKGRLSVQFRGQGKLKLLIAQCNDEFHIRGLAKWDGDLTYDDLMIAFSQGVLIIMLDMDNRPSGYQGIVNWRGKSLAESIEAYFQESEQLATKIWLNVSKSRAAGLMLQVIPAVDKDQVSLEKAASDEDFQRIIKATGQLANHELLTMQSEELLQKLYPQEQVRIFDPVPIQFKCTCSRKRSEDAIYLLGREEAAEELEANKSIVVTCDFCNKEYIYDSVDVDKIFAEREGKSTKQIH